MEFFSTELTKDEKLRNIGKLCASKSGGNSLFLMAEKKNAQGEVISEQIACAIM